MRGWIKRNRQFIPRPAWQVLSYIGHRWFERYSKDSYAQNGEDLILDWFIGDKQAGYYVDLGAHHPMRFSNTYRLYCRGWCGLNIDATPGSMDQFRRLRPRDTNIEAGVTFAPQELTFHVFKEQGLNTFDEHLAAQHMDNGRLLVKTLVIATVPLVELLDQYVPHNTQIDLLTIDVEGLDYDVLRSNDWDRYSPAFVLVECLDILTLDSVGSNIVTQFLSERHYSSVAKTAHTVLYKRMLSCEEINRQSGGAETMTSHERSGT